MRRFLVSAALILPGLVLFAVFFVWPLALLAESSLHAYSRLSGPLPGWRAVNYLRIFGDDYQRDAMLRTLRLGVATCGLDLLLAYPVALYLHIAPARQKAWIILCILAPLMVSVIVRSFGWLILLGPNGLLDTTARLLGLGGLVILHSELAVVIGLANVLLPFLVLSIATSLQAMDPNVPLAASSLGANSWRVFRKVLLPLTLPGMVSGLLIIFSLACSSFVTPALLGGGDNSVMSMVVYQQAMVLQNWPLASAVAAVLVAMVLLIILLQARLTGRAQAMVFH